MIEPCYALIGVRIWELRKLRGWNQTELAQRMKCSRGSLANIETGRERIPLYKVIAVARIFNVTPLSILKGCL